VTILVAPDAAEETLEGRVAQDTFVADGSLSAMRRMEFEPADYHGPTDRGRKSRGPVNGQDALDLSVQVKSTSPRRIGIDYKTGDFVVFDRTRPGVYHGHVRPWSELHQDQQRALIDAGMVDRRGNIWRGG
jgi:filamentous hemagglutinin